LDENKYKLLSDLFDLRFCFMVLVVAEERRDEVKNSLRLGTSIKSAPTAGLIKLSATALIVDQSLKPESIPMRSSRNVAL
jgi:hypothetical protein